MKEEVNTRQLIIGLNILALGVLFYYLFRSETYFLKFLGSKPNLQDSLSPLLTLIGNSLPTFVHVFALIVLTASIVANNKRGYLIVTLAWFTVDVLFEVGQGFGNSVSQVIPDWFSGYLFIENTRNYFLLGRFDYLDLLSIVLGSLAAYTLLIKTKKY